VSDDRLDDEQLRIDEPIEALREYDAPALPLAPDGELDSYVRRDLFREERAIARQFHGGRMWPYPVLTVACFGIWASLFPLAIMGQLGPWGLAAGCLFATFCCAYGFIPSHEAMHSNIVAPGRRHYWANELTGFLATIPIALGFGVARLTHMEHHSHTNDPELDPDFTDGAPSAWKAVLGTWWNRQPGVEGSVHRYKRMMVDMDTPASRRAAMETTLLQLLMFGTLFAMAWSGYAIEAALLWWLPRQIGLSWIRYWLSWAPHHPQHRGRYQSTRIFKTRWGHWASLGMQFHAIHHLYPKIPNHRTKPAFFAMKDVLARRGMDVSAH
jgi:beta-carotene hydroxylase